MRIVVLLTALLACEESGTSAPNTPPPTGTNTTPPPVTFACGDEECTLSQYCERFTPGVPPDTGQVEVTYSCREAPDTCGTQVDCACLSQVEGCMEDCDDTEPGVVCDFAAPSPPP